MSLCQRRLSKIEFNSCALSYVPEFGFRFSISWRQSSSRGMCSIILDSLWRFAWHHFWRRRSDIFFWTNGYRSKKIAGPHHEWLNGAGRILPCARWWPNSLSVFQFLHNLIIARWPKRCHRRWRVLEETGETRPELRLASAKGLPASLRHQRGPGTRKVCKVISGGQFRRTGRRLVPAPTEV